MSYADLDSEDLIVLAAEFVGRGVPIPHEIEAKLGHSLISEIQNPGAEHDSKTTDYPHQRRTTG